MDFNKLDIEDIETFLVLNGIRGLPVKDKRQVAVQLFTRGVADNFATVALSNAIIALDRSVRLPALINGTITRAQVLDMTDEQVKQWAGAFYLPQDEPSHLKLNLLQIAELQGKVQDPGTYTITFGERVENHKGMQMIGTLAEHGISFDELRIAAQRFTSLGHTVELQDLQGLLSPEILASTSFEPAAILIVRNGVKALLNGPIQGPGVQSSGPEGGNDVNNLYWEQKKLHYDTKAKMRGRVVNKHARHNICMADITQIADYEEGKGTVINFKDLPYLDRVREMLPYYLGTEKVKNLYAEGNHYYDVKTTYIDYHGDSERKIVVAIRLGASFPLAYQWHYKGEKIGRRQEFILNHGDFYVMSEKAVGTDWKRSIIPTLRHGAGDPALLKKLGDAKQKKKK